MNIDIITTLISSASLLVGGILGYLAKYVIQKKQDAISENNKIKRENYKKFRVMTRTAFIRARINAVCSQEISTYSVPEFLRRNFAN